jgi:hypothetical protein
MMDDLTELRRFLAKTEPSCQLLSHASGDAHFRFPGSWQRKDVIWDVRLEALHHGSGQMPKRQFIEVGEPDNGIVPAAVGLLLEQIRPGDILKTITMIRHYKRLHPGRHEWGRR